MSRTILNITFIHAIEVFVVLLVVVKLFQIRKLYIQSASRKKTSLYHRKNNRQTYVSSQSKSTSFQQTPAQRMFQDATLGLSRNNLPLPDVSFTEGLPLPEVSYLSENEPAVENEKEYSKNKAALNSYIDDMFFESSFEFEDDVRPFSLKKQNMKSHVDDEFITVAEENAQLVRDLEIFNQRISFAR